MTVATESSLTRSNPIRFGDINIAVIKTSCSELGFGRIKPELLAVEAQMVQYKFFRILRETTGEVMIGKFGKVIEELNPDGAVEEKDALTLGGGLALRALMRMYGTPFLDRIRSANPDRMGDIEIPKPKHPIPHIIDELSHAAKLARSEQSVARPALEAFLEHASWRVLKNRDHAPLVRIGGRITPYIFDHLEPTGTENVFTQGSDVVVNQELEVFLAQINQSSVR
jgi:hypothetical protein